MLARLEAQEHLDAIRGRGLAFGGYETRDAQAMIAQLQARAAGEELQRPLKASPVVLASMGIGMVSVPSQGAMNDG